jgi:glucose uptake protein GlcU
MTISGIGYIYAIIATITNGSFLVLYKLEPIAHMKIDPIMFQLYASVGIFLLSWLSAAFLPVNPQYVPGAGDSLEFITYAFLGGVIMILSMTCGFFSCRKIGVALAQGIFGGLAIIVSYIWALAIFGEIPGNIGLSIGGIILLVIGITGIAACKNIATYLTTHFSFLKTWREKPHPPNHRDELTNQEIDEDQDHLKLEIESNSSNQEDRPHSTSTHSLKQQLESADFWEGLIFAILCGLLGGSSLVPLHYVDVAEGGVAYLPSFGTGVMVTAPIVTVIYYKAQGMHLPSLSPPLGIATGIVCGMIWNISNIFSIGAIPTLGYGVAFPIIHSAILISGMWGIVLFHEFQYFVFAEEVFFFSGALIVTGAVMISIS